jgi:glycine oxidase
MTKTTDVLIAGGGVIGCALAYYLQKAGRQVMVVDQGAIGAQASSAAVGLLAPLVAFDNEDFVPFLLASWALFPRLVPELEAVSGVPIGYQQTGTLRTISHAKRVVHLERQMHTWQCWGFHTAWLTGDEARACEPLLSEHVCAAVSAPQEGQLNPSSLVAAFATAAKHQGAFLFPHCGVIGLQTKGAQVTGAVLSTGEAVACDYLVIAAGAWSTQRWQQWLGVPIPVRPVRGQVVALQQPAATPLTHILFGEGIYLAPKLDGTVVIGATTDEVGFDSSVTEQGIAWLRASAQRLVPALQACSLVRAWAGLRPRTADRRPILGSVQGWENVLLSTGHGAFGITLSPLSGLALTELLLTGQTPDVLRPFSLDRFCLSQEGKHEPSVP